VKISYNEATARDCSTLEKDLILCDKAGFDFIEIRFHMLRDYLKNHSSDDLKNFFDNHRLKPHAFNATYVFNEMFTVRNNDRKREQQVMDDFLLGCEVGKKIGARYIIVVADLYEEEANIKPYIDTNENIFLDSVRILTKLSDIANDYDINLCWEPVGSLGCAVKTVERAWDIVKAVNRDNVGLTLDVFNLHLYGKMNDFSIMSTVDVSKIFAVHVMNADDEPLGVLNHCHRRFCDSGYINLENFLGTLKEMGYDGMVSIETFRPEYWEKDAEWVISEAYRTTRDAVEKYGILG
jgi:2-keto-myo-inositol isomerase